MRSFVRMLTIELTGNSDYFEQTFKEVVEHIHEMALSATGRRRRYARPALEILLRIAKRTTLPLGGVGWVNELLWKAVERGTSGDIFVLFLGLRGLRKEEDGAVDLEPRLGQDCLRIANREAEPHSPGGTVIPATCTPERFLNAILKNVKDCSERDDGWQDEPVLGGLIAIRDIPRLGRCPPERSFLQTLASAMEKERPFRVRKAAYDVIEAAQDGWLRSADLRQTLEDLELPRKLHGVVAETGRFDHQLSFLEMMEILSENEQWHSYLRGAMDIWIPLRNEKPHQVIRILARIGKIPFPGDDGLGLPLDNLVVKMVEDEWSRVPGRPTEGLSIEQLEPLVEVTRQLKMLLFTESDRQAVLARVEQAIPDRKSVV